MSNVLQKNECIKINGTDYDYCVSMDGIVTSKKEIKGRIIYRIIKQTHLRIGYAEGYMAIQLVVNGKQKKRYVHRLLAQAFIPNPKNLPQVNHINGNSLDNRLENLEWVSSKENINHAWDNHLVKRKATRITTDLIERVKTLYVLGKSHADIGRQLNIDPSNSSRIVNKKRRFA